MGIAEKVQEALRASGPGATDGVGRVETLRENVVPTITPEQLRVLEQQLGGGDGGELKPSARHRPSAHSVYSSAVLALNVFGFWLEREQELRIGGLSGFDSLAIEAKQPIFERGKPPNLDVLLHGDKTVVGIESKLTETLARHPAREWRDTYREESCRALLEDGWRDALDAGLAGDLRYRYLNAEQLIKHALGLSKQNPASETHLVYAFWRPVGNNAPEEVLEHQREVEAFADLVGAASPRFRAMPYDELWADWDDLDVEGLKEHLAALRGRYVVRSSDLV